MSTISAGTTSGSALVYSGDTSGTLVLQTNGTTTAVTIGTNQVVTLAQPLPVGSGGTGSTASPTAGGVQYGTGTAVATTSAGTAGYLLQSNGASAPSWVAAPSASAMTKISTTVISGNPSSVTVTTGISSTYTKYKIIIEGLYDNSGASNQLSFQLYANGALDANNCYGNSGYQLSGAGSFIFTNSSSTSLWYPATTSVYNFNGAANYSMYLEIDLDTIFNTNAGLYTIKALSRMQTSYYGAPRSGVVGMAYQGSDGRNSAVTGFGLSGYTQFVGTINLYGIS